jgi:probable HAF family extracellular repeat protein
MRIIGLLLISAALGSANTIYSITNLGGMGGSESNAFAINAGGTAVGWAETPTGSYQAFVSNNGGALQNLSAPSASDIYAYGINGSGTVAGTAYVNGQPHGLIWNGSTLVDLGAGTYGTGINDAGAVVGGNGAAFLYSNGVLEDLGTLPGGAWSAAYGVNDAGTVVGYGTLASGICRGFIWTASGGMTPIGTFGGANSYANAVNAGGEVVGEASLASGYENAFVDIGGVMKDLGTLAGGNSWAYGINDSGSIVGYSWSPTGANPTAFLYSNGSMVDLNSLLPTGSGWQLLEAYGINDSGDIVGSGLFDGVASSFLLTPAGVVSAVPEPSAAPAIAIALALLLVSLRSRRFGAR